MHHRLKFVSSSIASLLLLVLLAAPAFSATKGNDVQFHGTVGRVETTTGGQGTLTLQVMGFDIPVRISSDTEIETHGDQVGLDGLKVGDFVKVSGFFSSPQIVAREIEVLDRGSSEFRLRGPITAVRAAAGGTVIVILGVDVLLDSDTKIERRGPDGGFTASNLKVGFFADARGVQENGRFIASRVKIGSRADDAIRVDFEGRITHVDAGHIAVDTEGGSTAVVLIASSTTVIGTPAVGRFVEVRGSLNSRLEVVAARIRVNASRNADDENETSAVLGLDLAKKVPLLPSLGSSIRGAVEIELELENGQLEQEMKVYFEGAQSLREYRIRVHLALGITADFSAFQTTSEGKAEIKFSSEAGDGLIDLRNLLPTGKTLRDLIRIQIIDLDGKIVAEGTF